VALTTWVLDNFVSTWNKRCQLNSRFLRMRSGTKKRSND
jgi:hypothetical protein